MIWKLVGGPKEEVCYILGNFRQVVSEVLDILTAILPFYLFRYLFFSITLSWSPPSFPFPPLDHLYPTIPLSTAPPTLSKVTFIFKVSATTPGYVLTPEDLELRSSDEKEHVIFVFWSGLTYVNM